MAGSNTYIGGISTLWCRLTVTRRMSLLVHELLTLAEHLSSPRDLGYLCLTEVDLNVIKIRFVCLLYPM